RTDRTSPVSLCFTASHPRRCDILTENQEAPTTCRLQPITWELSGSDVTATQRANCNFRRGRTLHGDLGPNFPHAAGGNLEIVGGVVPRTGQRDEQPVLPGRHARARGRLESTP